MKTLNDVLLIKLHGPPVEVFDPCKALSLWWVSWWYGFSRTTVLYNSELNSCLRWHSCFCPFWCQLVNWWHTSGAIDTNIYDNVPRHTRMKFRMANLSRRTRVIIKQMQSTPYWNNRKCNGFYTAMHLINWFWKLFLIFSESFNETRIQETGNPEEGQGYATTAYWWRSGSQQWRWEGWWWRWKAQWRQDGQWRPEVQWRWRAHWKCEAQWWWHRLWRCEAWWWWQTLRMWGAVMMRQIFRMWNKTMNMRGFRLLLSGTQIIILMKSRQTKWSTWCIQKTIDAVAVVV